MRVETTILRSLIYNEEYLRKVLPFLKPEYFTDAGERVIFEEIASFTVEYNAPPSVEAIKIAIGQRKLNEKEFDRCKEFLDDIESGKETTNEMQWLLDLTEEFCQDKAIYLAVMSTIGIIQGKDKNLDKGAIPKLLEDALAVSFDTNIGHDYIEDSEQRFDFYHRPETKTPFDIDFLNKITNGGVTDKTINIFIAGPNVGKSLVMCHLAASHLMMGKNVLYITMEMAEEKISERIDANLLNCNLDDIINMPRDVFQKRIAKLKSNTVGKLIIKEYPTATVSVTHFRALLNELKLKKGFVPDVIYVDYLNICCSARLKFGGTVGSFGYVKAIAEELRGLAVEYELPLITATQLNRAGSADSDPGMEDTSESFGIPYTADLMVAILSTDELDQLNQYMMKQLKNRYSDPSKNKRFVVGVEKAKMRLFNVEESGQQGITDSRQTPDRPLPQKSKFEGITV